MVDDTRKPKPIDQAAIAGNNDEALRQAAVLTKITDGVNVVSARNGRIVYNNPAFETMFGYAPGELIGQLTEVLNAPEGGAPEATAQTIIDALQRTGRWEGELLNRRKDGTTFWTFSTISCHDLPGWGAVWLGIQRDITERKQAEAVMAQRQALLDSIMVNTDVMLVYLDPQFNFVWVNQPYAETCHMQREELLGKNHFDLYPNAENEAIFRQVRDTGEAVFYKDKPFEFPDQPERGITYWDWSLSPNVVDGKVAGLVFSLRETTSFVLTSRALNERDGLLRAITDNAAEGIFVLDREHRQRYINPAAADIVRQAGVHPDWDAASMVGKTALELFGDTPTGRLFFEDDERVMQSGKVHSFEETIPSPAGARTLLTIRSPYFDDTGRVIGLIGTTRDITERKKAEVERLSNVERQRDALIREVHHRIKNHLQGIVGLLKNRIKEQPDIAAPLSEAVAQVKTIAQIYGLRGRSKIDRVCLDDVLRIALENMIHDVPIGYRPSDNDTSIALSSSEEVPAALIINELITNAAKHLSHDDPGRFLHVRLDIGAEEARIELRNSPAALPQDFDFKRGIGYGTGLELVRALLAPQGMELDFRQEGEAVVTTLRLFPPVIIFSS